jgi:hypothetical protein
MEGSHVNYRAVAAAAPAAFVTGAIRCSPLLFGDAYMTLRGPDRAAAELGPLEMAAELVRVLVVACVLARLAARLGTVGRRCARSEPGCGSGWRRPSSSGAVLHEGMPAGLHAIRAGERLAKTLVMAAILGAWRRRESNA